MRRRGVERRRNDHELRPKPPPSPANAVVLMVVGALGVFAAAAALMGSGYDDVTPHGRVLGELNRIADAQEEYHLETGEFADRANDLDVAPAEDLRLTLLRGDAGAWEAVVGHSVGLTCTQGGAANGDKFTREQPACFTPAPD